LVNTQTGIAQSVRKQDITNSGFTNNYVQSILSQYTQYFCIMLYRMHIPER